MTSPVAGRLVDGLRFESRGDALVVVSESTAAAETDNAAASASGITGIAAAPVSKPGKRML